MTAKPYEVLDDHPLDSAAWHNARRLGIGASEAAAVLGLNPWMTRLDVYRAKMGIPNEIDPDRAYFGHALEPVIAGWLHERRGWAVTGGFTARSVEWPWLTASPDRMRVVGFGGDTVPVELKSARSTWTDGPPLQYVVQVQQQIAVLGATHGWLVALHGGNQPDVHMIDRDDEFIDQVLIPETRAFWEGHVLRQDPPDPVTTAEAVTLWPGNPALEAVEADTEMLAIWQKLMFARKSKDLATAEAEKWALELQILLGDATTLSHDGTVLATWKPQAGARRLDTKQLRADHPDLVDAYTVQGDAQRRFLPKNVEVAA